jgi:hypothetical protein
MNLHQETFQLFAQWITFLWQAVPPKLQPTFLELLFGAMISRKGHITSALMCIRAKLHWNTYFKVIEKGHFSWLVIARQWLYLLIQLFQPEELILTLDDFITVRASKKAPSVGLHHDHAKRANRPKFLWGQLRLSMGIICKKDSRVACFPVLLKLMRATGNTNKLTAAKFLTKLLNKHKPADLLVKVLIDAWFMRGPLVLELIRQGAVAIGQARKDTAMFLPPVIPLKKPRGKPRKYGQKLSQEHILSNTPQQTMELQAYGKKRTFQFHCLSAQVRFLKGHLCKIVWSRFLDDHDRWTKWHLLICTDKNLSGSDIITTYALRWWTEPMFNELKNLFGLINAWQQTRQVLARWTMLLSLAYSLPRLLALWLGSSKGEAFFSIPWRTNHPVTAGWIAEAIAHYFYGFPIRRLWDRKSRKLTVPKQHFYDQLDQTG